MGHQLKNYEGVVVHIDLLGFGSLTNGKIQLKNQDYETWLSISGQPFNHHFLAGSLLVEFRGILQRLDRKYRDVTVAQLSDCFFAWSRHSDSVVKFTHAFMHEAISKGLLCRGGMAYGQIIETEASHRLGRLILGDAVTKAVRLEGIPKGARILTEPDLVMSLYSRNKEFSNKIQDFFSPFENPLDFSIYDEFRWYLANDFSAVDSLGPSNCSNSQKLAFTKRRLELDTLLIHSPKYGWNARNEHGKVHLKATSNFLSISGLLGVYHGFERRGFPEKRSEKRVIATNEFVNSDTSFTMIKS